MFCSGCGTENQESAGNCTHCSAPLPLPGQSNAGASPTMIQAPGGKKPPINQAAVASFVFGILGFVTFFSALPGIVYGMLAVLETGKRRGGRGRILGLAGLVISCVSFLFWLATLAHVFRSAQLTSQMAGCDSNVKDLCRAQMMYAQDHDEHFPLADRWSDELYPYVRDNGKYICPSGGGARSGYASNRQLSGLSLEKIGSPAETAALFDAQTRDTPLDGWNASGGAPLLDFRHLETAMIGYADGHAKMLNQRSSPDLHWDPAYTP